MKILFASGEIFPFAKSGGLADVAGALPKALSSYVDISSVMPFYGFMDDLVAELFESFTLTIVRKKYKIEIYRKKEERSDIYFINAPHLSDTQKLYGDKTGDYKDNDLRFALFCRGVVRLAEILHVKLLHLNDWHTALCALYVKEQKLAVKTVFTIHNLAYQGIFDYASLGILGIKKRYFTMDGVEFYGKINLLKAGIAYSNAVTTVSPSYAKETLTQEFGCGLDGFLQHHKSKLQGILNGIDMVVFDPKHDTNLAVQYSQSEGKQKNKTALLRTSKLKDPKRPLFVMISRLVEQKGVDLLMESIADILKQHLNLYIIGEGPFAKELEKIAEGYDNFEFFNGYNEKLSHQLYAAADFLLMPSRFEPCGLSQLIAMRYGTVPIVHAVGGLKDSVHEKSKKCGQGIVFSKFNKKSMLLAVEKAMELLQDSKKHQEMIRFNMDCDFSFTKSAQKYLNIYQKI